MVSVIIPVYNTPINCLIRCIESIERQNYNDYEVIVVNDGSKKHMADMYKVFLNKKPFVKTVDMENQGVSVARNIGISMADGEYLTFVDADDVVKNSFLRDAYKLAIQHDADVVIGGIEYTSKRGNQAIVSGKMIFKKKDIVNLRLAQFEANSSFDYQNGAIIGSPCGKLYRKSAIENIKFPKGIAYMEDQIFNNKVLSVVDVVVLSPEIWYTYYQNDFSALHSVVRDENYLKKHVPFWKLWNNIILNEKNSEVQLAMWSRNLIWFNGVVQNYIVPLDIKFREKYILLNRLIEIELFHNSCNKIQYKDCKGMKRKIMLFLMKYRLLLCIYIINKYKNLAEFKRNA